MNCEKGCGSGGEVNGLKVLIKLGTNEVGILGKVGLKVVSNSFTRDAWN